MSATSMQAMQVEFEHKLATAQEFYKSFAEYAATLLEPIFKELNLGLTLGSTDYESPLLNDEGKIGTSPRTITPIYASKEEVEKLGHFWARKERRFTKRIHVAAVEITATGSSTENMGILNFKLITPHEKFALARASVTWDGNETTTRAKFIEAIRTSLVSARANGRLVSMLTR